MQTPDHYTLPVGLRFLINGNYSTYWGYFAAGGADGGDPGGGPLRLAAAVHRERARAGRGEGLAVNQPASPPHHDGSELYVLERPDAPGGTASVRRARAARAGRHLGRPPPRPEWRTARGRGGDRHRDRHARPGGAPPSRHGTRRCATAGCRDGSDYLWLNGTGSVAHDLARRRRLRPLARPRRPGLAPRLGRLRDLPRPLRSSGTRPTRPPIPRLGSPSRLGRTADRARPGHATRVVRRRPRRDRAAPRPHRGARRQRPLPDADLPGREHPSLRRGELRRSRPAARRRPRARLADGCRP